MTTPTEFGPAELAELTERLHLALGGDGLSPELLREAVKACKPRRPRKARAPKPPTDPLVTSIRRACTNVTTLTGHIRDAKARIAEIRKTDGIAASINGHEAAKLYANLPSWENELTGHAENLARMARAYIDRGPTNEQSA